MTKVSAQPIVLAYYPNWDVYNVNLSTKPNKDFSFNSEQNLYKLARVNTVAYSFFEAAPDGTIQSFDYWSDFDSSDEKFCQSNPKICFKDGSENVNGGFGNFNKFANSGTTSGVTNRLIAFRGAGHDAQVQAAMNNPDNFVNSLKILKSAYDFTGLDFDYEPVGGVPEEYKTKLVILMKKVRAAMGDNFMITYTIIPNQYSIEAFGADNWREVEKTVNYINIMNYDIFGAWEKLTGLQSPLYPIPDTGGSGEYSADTAITQLNDNGVPSNKIVLGYPSYGRTISGVTVSGLGQPFTSTFRGNLDNPNCVLTSTPSTNPDACGGLVAYSKIVADNLPVQHQLQHGVINGSCSNFGAGVNGTGNAFMSFDDAASTSAKVAYAKTKGLAGMMTWGINYDVTAVNSDGSPNCASLLNAVIGAYGITPRPVTPPPAGAYFILQVSNLSPDVAGAYASATLVVNGNYVVFGNEWNKPITPGYDQYWSTSASATPPEGWQ